MKTGKRRWHFQLVHHGIWDFDIPCAPILMDITVNGKTIKAIGQPTKQNWVYVFDRTNGQPVWPIEERAVEKGEVPGEWYSPTQPWVTKPPAFDRQGITNDDLIDFTPELRAEAVKLVSRYKLGPLFTPPIVSTWEGPLGHADAAHGNRRRQLAGRFVRSRNEDVLHLLEHLNRRARHRAGRSVAIRFRMGGWHGAESRARGGGAGGTRTRGARRSGARAGTRCGACGSSGTWRASCGSSRRRR